MDLRALDEPKPLDICLLDDINVLAGWEYWLKLSYFTADLHVVRAWSLNSRATEVAFESQARVGPQRHTTPNRIDVCIWWLVPRLRVFSPPLCVHVCHQHLHICVPQALRGAIVYSFLDADRMQNPQSLDEALRGRRFSCDWEKQVFPTGALEAPACFSACPTGTFRVLLCKIATGSTLAHQESEGGFPFSS